MRLTAAQRAALAGDTLQRLVLTRMQTPKEMASTLSCPRASSDLMPCACRDGGPATKAEGQWPTCAGCGAPIHVLIEEERAKVAP